MKALDSFTVERLEEIRISFLDRIQESAPILEEVFALINIALAAKRAEESHSRREVWDGGNTWIQCSKQAYDRHEAAGKRVRVLYECPQLNSPEIPEGWKLVPIEPTQNMVDAHIIGMQLAGFSRAYRDMLAAAPEPQNQQQNIPEIIPQGWIKCSDRRPERGTDVQVYCSDTREQFVAFHLGNGEFQYAQHEDTSIACRPSHWMPIPAAPEKENG